jgi:hypothetical protein
MYTNEATSAPTTPGPSVRPRTGAKPLWYASRRRHARTRALATMPTVADAPEVA